LYKATVHDDGSKTIPYIARFSQNGKKMIIERQLNANSKNPIWEQIYCPIRITNDTGRIVFETKQPEPIKNKVIVFGKELIEGTKDYDLYMSGNY